MRKNKLYIFDKENRFLKVLVNPSQEEIESTNSILNPNVKHLMKFPMEHFEKEGGLVVIRNKEVSKQAKPPRQIEEITNYSNIEAKIKDVLQMVKNQNNELESAKKENIKLRKKSYRKVLAVSIAINIVAILAVALYLKETGII